MDLVISLPMSASLSRVLGLAFRRSCYPVSTLEEDIPPTSDSRSLELQEGLVMSVGAELRFPFVSVRSRPPASCELKL